MQRQRPVPASRFSRLVQMGRLGSGIAGGVVGEGLRQLGSGNRPKAADLLLTPANARRLAERLSEMRGAAMKIGQLLSMEAGDVIPDPLPDILSRLREQANPMPLGQVADVLDAAWGTDWKSRFRRFRFTPMAAASIGQVHEAETKDGRRLAIKIQYSGIARSIDSDLDNVVSILRLFRFLPAGLDIEPLIEEAKLQLHMEADYLMEADHLRAFAFKLGSQPGLLVPGVADDLTTDTVLAMEMVDGDPIETLAAAPRETRERVAVCLTELALRELLVWRLMQTEPNFANFRYRGSRPSRASGLRRHPALRAGSGGRLPDIGRGQPRGQRGRGGAGGAGRRLSCPRRRVGLPSCGCRNGVHCRRAGPVPRCV